MAHTPGPWNVSTENKGAIPEHFRPLVVLNSDGDRVIARLPDGRAAEDRANAALIAAAPEMRELLSAAFERLTDNDMQPPNEKLRAWLDSAADMFERLN